MISPSSEDRSYSRGRIRLSESEAVLALEMLSREINRMLDARSELVLAGNEDGRGMYNAKIAAARRIEAEIERTANEKGWAEALAVLTELRGETTTD